jgi:hypothetical protein
MYTRIVVAGLLIAGGLAAQAPPGPGGRGGGPRFLGAEAGMPGKVVKSAPYSAEIVSESVQALPDGNHIRQSSTVRVYRDSDGRTRREATLGAGAMAMLGAVSQTIQQQVIFINDPVAKVNYALNPQDKTGTKSAWPQNGTGAMMAGRRPMMPGGGPGGRGMMMGGPGGGPPPGRGPEMRAAVQNAKTDSLGRQTIEGIPADGTRTTITIPVGQMGNEQPIVVVRESWFSPDLQVTVLSKNTDPRFGDSTSKMTNITRAEPAHTLFEPPADYKITEGSMRAPRQ